MINYWWPFEPRDKKGRFTTIHKKNPLQNLFSEVLKRQNPLYLKENIKGGKYGDLRKITKGDSALEIHHMPANSISPLSRWNGPCIIMFKEDHKLTSSYKNSKHAQNYRNLQHKLINQGKFLEAELMDINEIRQKFQSKYNKAINEKLDYEEKLKKEGKLSCTNLK